ncbi:DUF2634 domain-containing protein [uncultured Clostridium sp.]|uniref:DUF2634 domain-containing protein n=1 Tax=uncultured Clostridium sp. TaxID=59620 RepID=UPI0025ED4AD0|nr:DUF2634 domain-containing protein [uncultured Clostridium sp.]
MSVFPDDYGKMNYYKENKSEKEIELLKEYAVNFETEEISNTEFVYGIDAIAVRVWLIFLIRRNRWFIYLDVGSKIKDLRGEDFEYAQLHIEEILKEALIDDVYITDVVDISLSYKNDKLTVEFTVVSIYGNYEGLEEVT